MKKKFLTFILCVCFIIPGMFCLSACSNDVDLVFATKNDVQVYAEYEDTDSEHHQLKSIVLKATVGGNTAYLYGGGWFTINWKSNSGSSKAFIGQKTDIKDCLNSDNEIIAHHADLLYNFEYSFAIPENVNSIGWRAFSYTSLKSITMGNISVIYDNPFAYCNKLESIKITSELSNYDTRNDCNTIIDKRFNMVVSTCLNSVIPNSVTTIGNYAFQGSPIETLHIPNSISVIGDYAFKDSALNNITLPNTVYSIGDEAFAGCDSLTTITFEEKEGYKWQIYDNNEWRDVQASELFDLAKSGKKLKRIAE